MAMTSGFWVWWTERRSYRSHPVGTKLRRDLAPSPTKPITSITATPDWSGR
jgi:hypothetical protein